MPYINPGQYLAPYFEPQSQTALRFMPVIQQQQELQAKLPYMKAQAAHANEQALQLQSARNLYNQMMGGQGETLPAGTEPGKLLTSNPWKEEVVRHYLGLGAARETPQEAAAKALAVEQTTRPIKIQGEVERQKALTPGEVERARLTRESPEEEVRRQQVILQGTGPIKVQQKVQEQGALIPGKVAEQQALLPGKLREKKEGEALSPTQQIAQQKLEVWQAYLNGSPLSQQQKQIIGVDVDPYIKMAAQQIAGDIKTAFQPLEVKVQLIEKQAQLLRELAQRQQPGGKPVLPAPKNGQPAKEDDWRSYRR